ncbi:MAG TPA: CHAD domain-containing protein [Terriglobia bacterium]|nr:CHAD domain-containing protein [Terriglobia bacterium]
MANSQNPARKTAPEEPRPELRVVPPAPSEGEAAGEKLAPKAKTHVRKGGAPSAEWVCARGLAIKQLNRCVSLEPKVLQGDNPGAIHDLRVATRRLQQALDLMFPSPRPGEIRKLRKRLKRCRSALSEVRNCDVLLERVDSSLARKRMSRRQARSAIRDYLVIRRAARLEKALHKLTAANLSEVYVRMKEFLLRGGEASAAGGNEGPQNLTARQFHALVGENLKGVWGTLDEQIARSRRKPQAAVLHRVRIAAKRLRYLVEILHAFEVSGSAEVLVWLRGLQKHLGNWHDLVVFEEMAVEMVADPRFLRDHLELAMDIERLILKNRRLKTKFEGKYLEAVSDQANLLRIKEWAGRIIASPVAALSHA